MFTPFQIPGGTAEREQEPGAPAKAPETGGDIDELKRQLSEVQKRLDKLSGS
jgi:hypothetical protein